MHPHCHCIDHTEKSGLHDGDVEMVLLCVEPNSVRRAGYRHPSHIATAREIERDDHSAVARDEGAIGCGVQIETVWAGRRNHKRRLHLQRRCRKHDNTCGFQNVHEEAIARPLVDTPAGSSRQCGLRHHSLPGGD
jgi:hypothetical protein